MGRIQRSMVRAAQQKQDKKNSKLRGYGYGRRGNSLQRNWKGGSMLIIHPDGTQRVVPGYKEVRHVRKAPHANRLVKECVTNETSL